MIGEVESPAPPAGDVNEGPINEVRWSDAAPAGSPLRIRRTNRTTARHMETENFIGNLKWRKYPETNH